MVRSLRTQGGLPPRLLRRDNRGIASTVATMLSLLVMLLFLDLAIVEIIPRQQNDAEFATTQSAISSFQLIHGLAQGAVISGGDSMGSPGLTVALPLGTLGVSPLQAPTTGTLTFDPSVGTAQMWFTFVPHFRRGEVTHVDQDIILAIDSSGSMAQNDPSRLRISGAKEYIGRLSCPDHVAIVDFDNDAFLTKQNVGGAPHHLTMVSHNCFPNFDEAKTDVDTIDQSGSTNYGAALLVANNELLGYGDKNRARVIILLTDGQNTCCPNQQGGDTLAQAQARRARDNGIVIYTIGLGSDVDTTMLQYIADTTGGTYYAAPTAASIRWIYYEISRHFTGAFVCGDLTSGDTGSGRLSLELRNREFPAQTLSYESGGIVRSQSDGARVLEGPGVSWASTDPKGPQGELTLDLVALTGKEFRVDGSENQLVSIRPVARDLQELTITKVNLTDVNTFLTSEKATLDYWYTQGAATAGAVAAVKGKIDQVKNALATGQTHVNQGNLTAAKFDIDSASSRLSDVIAQAQIESDAGTMQKWLADDVTDDMLLQACYLTQWANWYDGVSLEITSQDAAAWEAWLTRAAKSSKMQYIVTRPGNTAILTIRAVDKVTIERRVLTVSLAG
ncbi:MAG TPA: vWA domain-containing protein [Thermoplasmata archaeon]|nr:vWA domain-containing protein [Thermoplasmata archaeon]